MSVRKRSVYFCGREAEKMMLLLLVCCLAYGFIFRVDNPGKNMGMEIIEGMRHYLPPLSMVFLFIMQWSTSRSYLSTLISMGATRREVVGGIQFGSLVFYLQAVAFYLILNANQISCSKAGVYSGGLLLAFAMGQLGNAVVIKVNANNGIVAMMSVALTMMAVLFLMLMFGLTGYIQNGGASGTEPGFWYTVFQTIRTGGYGCLAVEQGIGLGIYMISVFALKFSLSHYEVRG